MIGAIIGDTVGSIYEFHNVKYKEFTLLTERSRPTDDSIMTLAVAEICQNKWYDNKDKIIDTMKKWGRTFPNAGYGGHFFHWVLGKDREPYNSYGNGSAMRVSPAGWYGNSEEEVKHIAKCVTEVTHNHKEGIKGAEVTAMCIYYARIGKDKEFIKNYVASIYPEILDLDYEELRRTYVHAEEICQVTVPQAIYCFLISKDFEDCLRTTISIGGDCDTTSAISCAIAEAYYKEIPEQLYKDVYNKLPDFINGCDAKRLWDNFENYKNNLSNKIEKESIIEIVKGDITTSDCDAIVNAANSSLKAGGGVCGAIFTAAGYNQLQKECDSIGHCSTGNAVITKGYNLKAKYIIHAVGPIYRDDSSAPYLRNAYYNSLKLASDKGLKSIAFPSISTGIYGYPLEKTSEIAIKAIKTFIEDTPNTSLEKIIFYCFDDQTYENFKKEL